MPSVAFAANLPGTPLDLPDAPKLSTREILFKDQLRTHRQGRLGRVLGQLSYTVYIIHIAVMGPIAVVLLHTEIPALVKYPTLALATYASSNLIAFVYTRWKEALIVPPYLNAGRSQGS